MYSYNHVTQQQQQLPISGEGRFGDDSEEVPQQQQQQQQQQQREQQQQQQQQQREQGQAQTQATLQTQKSQVEARQPSNAAGLLPESAVELDASVSAKTEGESLPEVEAEVEAGGGVGAGVGDEGAGVMRAFPARVVPGLARVPDGQGSGSLPYEVYSKPKLSKPECMFLLTLQVRAVTVGLRIFDTWYE